MFRLARWFWRRAQANEALAVMNWVEKMAYFVETQTDNDDLPVRRRRVVDADHLISAIHNHYIVEDSSNGER